MTHVIGYPIIYGVCVSLRTFLRHFEPEQPVLDDRDYLVADFFSHAVLV